MEHWHQWPEVQWCFPQNELRSNSSPHWFSKPLHPNPPVPIRQADHTDKERRHQHCMGWQQSCQRFLFLSREETSEHRVLDWSRSFFYPDSRSLPDNSVLRSRFLLIGIQERRKHQEWISSRNLLYEKLLHRSWIQNRACALRKQNCWLGREDDGNGHQEAPPFVDWQVLYGAALPLLHQAIWWLGHFAQRDASLYDLARHGVLGQKDHFGLAWCHHLCGCRECHKVAY